MLNESIHFKENTEYHQLLLVNCNRNDGNLHAEMKKAQSL